MVLKWHFQPLNLKWTPAFLVVESMPIRLYGIFRNTYNRKFYYNESYMGVCGRSLRSKWSLSRVCSLHESGVT